MAKEPWDQIVPVTLRDVTKEIVPPAAYIIPKEWTHVIFILESHHVNTIRLTEPWTGEVETYQCSDMVWHKTPFEGRHPIMEGEGAPEDAGKFASACQFAK